MKTFNFFLILSVGIFFIPQKKIAAQTPGTMTFTFTEPENGHTKNVLAVWVEDNSGNFIKTRMRYWGNGTNDHLPTWKTNSSQNIVDASTGATLTSSTNPTAFGVKTVVWDGKDINGAIVADGDYKIYVESSWNNPEPSYNHHSTIVSYTFTKGAASTHATPAGNSYFSSITIDWVPSASAVENLIKNKNIAVFPNPSVGNVFIRLRNSVSVSRILLVNISGEVVYQESLNKKISGIHNLNLQKLPSGLYFVEILSADEREIYKSKLILSK